MIGKKVVSEMTMSTSEHSSDKPLILPYQKPVFDRLCAVARACLYVNRSQFSALRFRACFWLIGPTGSGKTFLASALAREMQVPFLSVSVSDWIILGGTNRGSCTTWPTILNFLVINRQKRGAIIFIDELDKCREESNWNSFLRSEIFSLCDSRIPLGINDLDLGSDDDVIAEGGVFLRDKVMILGGAAFQEIWDGRSSRSLGFNPAPQALSQLELTDLTRTLPRELINRFSSEIFVLPQISESDYRIMVETMAEHVPDTWRKRFLELGLSRIEQAVKHQKGARFLEEVLLSAVVEERAALANFVPEPEAPSVATKNPDEELGVS